MKINKKWAYLIVVLATILALVLYYCLNYHFRLPQGIPSVIGSLGGISFFLVKRKYDEDQGTMI